MDGNGIYGFGIAYKSEFIDLVIFRDTSLSPCPCSRTRATLLLLARWTSDTLSHDSRINLSAIMRSPALPSARGLPTYDTRA